MSRRRDIDEPLITSLASGKRQEDAAGLLDLRVPTVRQRIA